MGYSISCFYILFLFIIVINHVSCISDLRACANEDCSEIISYAKTKLTYMSDNEYSLSFPKNSDVIVYSKSAGSDTSLWGVSINGVRGYAPKEFLRETKKIGKIRFEVPTEYYEVVNNELVRKKDKPKAEKQVKSEKNNSEILSSDYTNNVVLGSEENNNTDVPQAQHTEELKTEDSLSQPTLLSGVSGEIVDSQINATPSSVVIDGTTLPPSLYEDEGEGSQDEGIQEDYEEVSGSGDEPEPIESNKNQDIPESPTQQNKIEPEHSNNVPSESSVQDIKPSKDDVNIVQNNNTEPPQTPQTNQNVEEEYVQSSVPSDVVKPVETNPPNIPEVPPVKVDSPPLGPITAENIQSSQTDQAPHVPVQDTVVPPPENISNESLNNVVPEVPPANESNIPEENPNPVPEVTAQPPDVSKDDTKTDIPPVNIVEPIKEEPVKPNPDESSYSIPPEVVIDPNLQPPNKEENIVQSPQTPINENIVSPDIAHYQDNIVMSSSTESPSLFTTISGSGYEIPRIPEALITESPHTDQYVSSTTPSISLEEPATTDSPQISDPDVNSNEQNIYNFSPESSSMKYEEHQQAVDNFDKLFEKEKESVEPAIESVTEPAFENDINPPENGESFLSNILKSFSSVTDQIYSMFKSSGKVEEEIEPHWREEKLSDDEDRVIVGWDAFIASFLPAYSALPQCRPEENVIAMTEVSTDMVMWLVISAVSVVAFTLGYYFLENRKQDGKLLAMVNSLQKELLCSSKECIILKDELTITKEKLIGIEDSSFGSDEMVACLRKEIADAQHTISELQDRLTQSEEELANSTEAALELQTILDDQLSSKDTSNSSLTFTVSNLQAQLDEQQTTMNLTKGQLAAKVEENEMLMAKMVEVGSKTAMMEKELLDTQKQLHQARDECENKSQQLQELSTTMEKSLQELKSQKVAEIKELQSQLKNCKSELESSKVLVKARAHEVASLQENLKLLKIDGTNIDALVDVSHTKAELTQATTEKNILAEKLEKEQSLLSELTNKVEVQENQMKQMRDQLNEAEQKAIQATSRLDVLTNYFNQKEAELIKELSTKEGLWLSQQGENMSTIEKIQSLQQEIQQYKETTEGVRRELAEQEAAWRARNAALERKAHEQWLARRAAERQAEASSSEAQSLRQRLAAPSPTDKPQGMVSPLNSVEGIGDLPMLPPPHLPFPPFPLGGLPPPPFLPPPLPPHRPPPLGRLSSPPPLPPQQMRHDRYSPDSRYNTDRERDYSPDRRSQNRGRSPYSQDGRRRQYNSSRRYEDDDRYYDSGEDRRSHRRYDETETDFSPPPSPPRRRAGPRNHKGVSSGSGQSSESLERISKHSNKY